MPSKRPRRSGLAALTAAVVVVTGAPAQADLTPSDHGNAAARETTKEHGTETQSTKAYTGEAHGITAEELEAAAPKLMDPPARRLECPERPQLLPPGVVPAVRGGDRPGRRGLEGTRQERRDPGGVP